MIKASEQQHLIALKVRQDSEKANCYKACVAVACNGLTLAEEQQLSPDERALLEVRRKLFASDLVGAKKILAEFTSEDPLLKGDHLFLQGQLCHRTGDQQETSAFMNQAADQYRLMGDYHRELRARVNGALCIATLESCLVGDLFILEMEARRQGFSDIAANICRSRAAELLMANRLSESYTQAMEASTLYIVDGYVDDRAVALTLAAIAQFCLGNVSQAQELRSQVLITEGKVATYVSAYDQLIQGRTPKIPKGHSLSGVAWNKIILKPESVTGKIILALRDGPKTKHELIQMIWEDEAINETYDRRLYSAINQLRAEKSIAIGYDGERYYLP